MYRKLLRNSSYLLAAQLLTKGLSLLYTFFLLKHLTVEYYGLYTVALSYFGLLSAFSELGINRYLTREVAVNRQRLASILGTVILVRIVFSLLTMTVFGLVLYYFDHNDLRFFLSLLAILAILPQALALTFDSIYIGLQKVFWSAVGLIVLNLTTATSGVLLILLGWDVMGVTLAILIGQVVYALFLATILILKAEIPAKSMVANSISGSAALMREVLTGSLPYGLLGILGLVYFKIDTIILSYLRSAYEVGIYGAAYRFLEAVIFIPSVIATTLFPVLAQLHHTNKEDIKKIYWKSVQVLFIGSLILLLIYIFGLPLLIKLLFPQYLASIAPLQILALTIPFMFIHVPGSVVLISSDKYLKSVLLVSVLTVSFNIIANFLLIPNFGFIGAAWVTVMSEALSFVIFFVFLQTKVFNEVKQ